MHTSSFKFAALLSAAVATCCVGPMARAAFVVDFAQVGPDVVATGSGSINTTALSGSGSSGFQAAIWPEYGSVFLGPATPTNVTGYEGAISGPNGFGPYNDVIFANSGSGNPVGLDHPGDVLYVPSGYVSGSPLADSATWSGQSFASLGVTPGTYTWTWGSGPTADSFTLNIPEPTSLVLLALLCSVAAAHRGGGITRRCTGPRPRSVYRDSNGRRRGRGQ